MLKVNNRREIFAEFYVTDQGEEKLVKTVTVFINHEAVSTTVQNLQDAELYAKYRKEMRQDEQALRSLRYKIEDEILAELEKDKGEE